MCYIQTYYLSIRYTTYYTDFNEYVNSSVIVFLNQLLRIVKALTPAVLPCVTVPMGSGVGVRVVVCVCLGAFTRVSASLFSCLRGREVARTF